MRCWLTNRLPKKKAVIAAMEQLLSSIVPFGGMLMAAILFDSCQNCRANTWNSKEMVLLFYFTFIDIFIIFFLIGHKYCSVQSESRF